MGSFYNIYFFIMHELIGGVVGRLKQQLNACVTLEGSYGICKRLAKHTTEPIFFQSNPDDVGNPTWCHLIYNHKSEVCHFIAQLMSCWLGALREVVVRVRDSSKGDWQPWITVTIQEGKNSNSEDVLRCTPMNQKTAPGHLVTGLGGISGKGMHILVDDEKRLYCCYQSS